jgi:thiosulfate/3-mercaptopyruvate sulfurtransferase
MKFTTLIEAQELADLLEAQEPVVVDCRFSLADAQAGERAYLEKHIASAVYAHLERDLSGEANTDHGRHPFPSAEAMRATFGRLGINAGRQVIVYDDANGAIAARLWWMLRYMGHDTVAVLNGGWQQWVAGDYALRSGREVNAPVSFAGSARVDWLVLAEEVMNSDLLVDSRAPERYSGEVEPIDLKAGHIPGAVNFHFERNWGEDGRFQSTLQLKEQLGMLVGSSAPANVTFYCGSGVTACNNLLAMAHAGLGDGRLYAGSWSDWISAADRPIRTGGLP